MRRHGADKPFECEICHKRFACTYDMRKHSMIHLTTEDRPYKCEVCGKGFYLIAAYKVHVRVHTGEKPYKCDHCDRAFYSRQSQQLHVKIHMDKSYQCEYCGMDFWWITNLNRHLKSVHTEKGQVKIFECSECMKTFGRKAALKAHLRTHIDERLYACDVCALSFSEESLLSDHKKSHEDAEAFNSTFLEFTKTQIMQQLQLGQTNPVNNVMADQEVDLSMRK